MKKGIAKLAGGITCGLLCLGALSANAVVYSLGTGNSAISGYPAPYGTVTVNLVNSTTATITFSANSTAAYQYLFGGQGAAGVNVNATSFALSGLSGTTVGTGFTSGPLSNGGAANEDGFGAFNLTIDSFDGYQHSSGTISFTLTDLSGTWGNANSVLVANANGAFIGAHIFVTTNPADANNPLGALATGYAANGGAQNIPDGGSTVALLGLAMLGIGSVRRLFA